MMFYVYKTPTYVGVEVQIGPKMLKPNVYISYTQTVLWVRVY